MAVNKGGKMIIKDTAFQILEVKPMENDALSIVEKNLVNSEWNTKVIILNRREALLIHQAISDIILSPVRR